jgi:hypothetical protein
MGDLIFIFSGLIALAVVTMVVKLLYRLIPNFVEQNIKRVIVTIGGIYIVFNSFYFTNVIPPIPLSLTKLEVAHEVSRTSHGAYRVVSEDQPWYRQLPFTKTKLNSDGSSVACFARVFAPTNLTTDIYHKWEYKDEAGNWQEHFRFGYEIAGTNEGGYGGYTVLRNFFSGTWRCTVETERGQVLSRETVVIEVGGEARDREIRFE